MLLSHAPLTAFNTPHPPRTPPDPPVSPPGSAASGLQQYITSLDAENARMMAEIQGLSVGGGAAGGHVGFPGIGSDLNTGSSSLLSGSGAEAGIGGSLGYLGPGLHGNQRGMDGGVAAAAGHGMGNGGSGTVGQEQGGAKGERGVGVEWNAAVMGGVDGGEPLSPRNREYRRKMIEMDAEHKVQGSARLIVYRVGGGGAVRVDDAT